jgi:uncharacterized protein (DUF1684 family)
MDAVQLAGYREAVARLYLSDAGLVEFRAGRDKLFATHPQSPIPIGERAGFTGLRYFPPSEAAVADSALRDKPGRMEIDTGGPDGVLRYERVGLLDTPYGELSLWWLDAYGGGLFLPFRDATSGRETYGGGRYLTDTVKGTYGRGVRLLGTGRVRLDFNYAYNPSCAYDSAWACPLAPPENRLADPVPAGELVYASGSHVGSAG